MTIEELLRMLSRMERTGNMDCLTDSDCIKHAIEAIKLVELISQVGGTNDDELGFNCNGGWCKEQAQSWVYSLEAK